MTQKRHLSVATILGARPQFIKAAPVSRALQNAGLRETLIHTGQHYSANMSDNIWHELSLPAPWRNLGIGSMPHGAQTGSMLIEIEKALDEVRPDWVLVYGDTNSTLAGALAASKMAIPIAHVEAGLRSFVRTMPEEINRVLTDHVSDALFTPTDVADENLLHEGIASEKIHRCGDVMYDAALMFADRAVENGGSLEPFGVAPKDFILATVHRAENTDNVDVLKAILSGLARVAEKTKVLLPLHPRTKAMMDRHDLHALAGGIRLIEPVGYLDMLLLEQNAALIATDSGGVQKEAFFFKTPCVTLRKETEWTETVTLGANVLVDPASADDVVAKAVAALEKGWIVPEQQMNVYGDGQAAERIAAVLS